MSTLGQMLEKATRGPWAWFDDNKASSPYLATVDRGRTYVMGFARRGWQAAQPVFQVREPTEKYGVMRTADEIGPDWPKHPDAALIVYLVNHAERYLALEEAARRSHPPGEIACDDGPIHRALAALDED